MKEEDGEYRWYGRKHDTLFGVDDTAVSVADVATDDDEDNRVNDGDS